MIDWVQERLPLLSRTKTRSPGWTKMCILRATLTWSWPALVRESEAITRPCSGPDAEAVGHGAPAPLRGPAPILGIRSSMLPEPAAMRLTPAPTGITVSHADPHRLRAGLRGAPAHADAADALRPSRGGAARSSSPRASWSSRRSRSRASSTGSATAARASLAPAGTLRIRYDNVVDGQRAAPSPDRGAAADPGDELPPECWRYLLASRYCEVDRMVRDRLGPLRQDAGVLGARAGGAGLGARQRRPSATSSRGPPRPRSTSTPSGRASAATSSTSPSRSCAR